MTKNKGIIGRKIEFYGIKNGQRTEGKTGIVVDRHKMEYVIECDDGTATTIRAYQIIRFLVLAAFIVFAMSSCGYSSNAVPQQAGFETEIDRDMAEQEWLAWQDSIEEDLTARMKPRFSEFFTCTVMVHDRFESGEVVLEVNGSWKSSHDAMRFYVQAYAETARPDTLVEEMTNRVEQALDCMVY